MGVSFSKKDEEVKENFGQEFEQLFVMTHCKNLRHDQRSKKRCRQQSNLTEMHQQVLYNKPM